MYTKCTEKLKKKTEKKSSSHLVVAAQYSYLWCNWECEMGSLNLRKNSNICNTPSTNVPNTYLLLSKYVVKPFSQHEFKHVFTVQNRKNRKCWNWKCYITHQYSIGK